MENEVRFYLHVIKNAIAGTEDPDRGIPAPAEKFKPTHIITVVELPTGAREVAINVDNIAEKVEYILDAYDDDMRLKTNENIKMLNMMIV